MLFLRGLRWRRGFSIAVLVMGVISSAVAALGPLYARAAGESTLTDDLRAAGANAGLAFTAQGPARDAALVARTARVVAAAGAVRGYGHPILGESMAATAYTAGAEFSTTTIMVWRTGVCGQVVLVTGRCPRSTGEAMVPVAAVTSAPRWRVGGRLTIRQAIEPPDPRAVAANGTVDGPVVGRARIVGSYRPRDFQSGYWFGLPYFTSRLGPGAQAAIRVGVDAIFVAHGQFVPAPASVKAHVDVDLPLLPSRIRLDNVSALSRAVGRLEHRYGITAVHGPETPTVRTQLFAVLASAARDRREVRDATLVVVLELTMVSLLVLFQVVNGAVAARGDEIALAKLRGLSPVRTVLFTLGEPIGLLAVAAPLGFALALAVAGELTSSALVRGTPVAVTGAVGWALAAAFAGSALAALAAARRTVTRPVLEQWRATSPPVRSARTLLLFDIVLTVLAVAAVVGLRTDGRARTALLVAPALFVLAVALMGVRLLAPLLRLWLPSTRAGRRIATFLALRQTVRRPSGLRLATLLAVATGLATFAVCGEAVAQGNRVARGETETGATRRLTVQFESDHDPETIVDTVDAAHRWALAAATWSSDGGGPEARTINGYLLGVQAERLSAVGYDVRGQLSSHALANAVAPSGVRPAPFRGTRLRVDVDTVALAGDRPALVLQYRHAHGPDESVSAGTLQQGAHTYTAQVDCAGGCAFAGMIVDRSVDADDRITGSLRIRSIDAYSAGVYQSVHMTLDNPGSWYGRTIGTDAGIAVARSGSALAVTYHATASSSPDLVYADSPAVLPVVAAPASLSTPTRTGLVSDYTGAGYAYRVVQEVSPLPVVLDTGAVADLDYLRVRLPNFDREATWSVWLGPHAPSDALGRLRHAGLLVQNATSVTTRVGFLARQGPALGLLLLLVCAVAAAVLAVGGTAISLLADARRRLFELAALQVVGVPRHVLRRSAVAEQALLLGVALVLGLPAGFVAAALVLPVVPEFSDPTPVVMRYQPSVLLALACAGAFVVLLGVTATVAGRAMARAAVPSRLREATR